MGVVRVGGGKSLFLAALLCWAQERRLRVYALLEVARADVDRLTSSDADWSRMHADVQRLFAEANGEISIICVDEATETIVVEKRVLATDVVGHVGSDVDETSDVSRLQADLDRCLALIPGEDEEPWVVSQPYADDAASAVAYTLRTLQSGDPQESAWAARRAYDAVDHYVSHRVGSDDGYADAGHPTIQAELLRQRRDLDELCAAGQGPNASEAIVRLRDRARLEAGFFLAGLQPGARHDE